MRYSHLYLIHFYREAPLRTVSNFIQFAVNGMNQCSRSNVIYLLGKSLGTQRLDGSDSLLPAKRMPMGLIEYCVNFFNAKTAQQVSLNCVALVLFCYLPAGILPIRLPVMVGNHVCPVRYEEV